MKNVLTAKGDVNHTIFDDHFNPLFCYGSVLHELEDIGHLPAMSVLRILEWFSKRTGTSLQNGKARG